AKLLDGEHLPKHLMPYYAKVKQAVLRRLLEPKLAAPIIVERQPARLSRAPRESGHAQRIDGDGARHFLMQAPPPTWRLKRSITTARNSQPSAMWM
ncbi:MAG: hypothetical protein LH479_04175, partial [Polaromonas sp.]|nr:hypothetical protein [Polaromonas sp.]